MFGVSALYHRVNWRSTRVRTWMRRLDHSTILLLIAGTYTPFALLAFDGTLGDVDPRVVWCGAAAGLVLNLVWVDAPKWLTALVFIALGWVGVVAVPELFDLGVAPAVLVFVGGALYTLGALAYAFQRPNPVSGDLRLPRDLPPARDRGRGGALRRDRGVRPARGLTRLQRLAVPWAWTTKIQKTDAEWRAELTPGAVRGPPAQGHRARVHRRVQRHEGPGRLPLRRAAARSSSAPRRSSTPAPAGRASSSRRASTASSPRPTRATG